MNKNNDLVQRLTDAVCKSMEYGVTATQALRIRDALRANLPAGGEAVASFSDVTVLPDGSAFAVASFALPKDHWLYAPRGEWDVERNEFAECPRPILTGEQRDSVIAAVRYAIRGATMCGKETDFDPDALVQNAAYALCGPYGLADNRAHHATAALADIRWAVARGWGHAANTHKEMDADLAEAITQEVASLYDCSAHPAPSVSAWVPVSERLPDMPSGYVLVHCEGGNITNDFFCRDREFHRHAGNYYFRKVQGKESGYFQCAHKYGYRITHWMPLPPAPTASGEGEKE